MTAGTLPGRAIFGSAVAMGLAGDLLLRAPGGAGLNLLLLFVGLSVSILVVRRGAARPTSDEESAWLAVGLLFATGLVWRGSPTLRLLSFLAAAGAFAIPALYAGRPWVRRAGVGELIEAIGGAGLHTALGGVRLVGLARPGKTAPNRGGRRWRWLRTAFGGITLAALPIIVFGALFASADPVFAELVSDLFHLDLDALWSHLIPIAALSWLTAGYLSGSLTGTNVPELRRLRPTRLGVEGLQVVTAVALVDLVFLGFVVIQFRFLFAGAEFVEVTDGLTYAQYAREGFFQLTVATGLALPWLLLADWLVLGAARRERSLFIGLAGCQLLLLLAVAASALRRMGAYQAAYGLTESRLFATAILFWLIFVLLWFATTALRGRRDRFAFGALISGFVLVAGLQFMNPDAFIVRSNLSHSGRPSAVGPSSTGDPSSSGLIDIAYLSSLGSDAVPALLESLSDLPEASRCAVARRLLRRWGPGTQSDWRSWNWSRWRAQAAVQTEAIELLELAPSGATCPG